MRVIRRSAVALAMTAGAILLAPSDGRAQSLLSVWAAAGGAAQSGSSDFGKAAKQVGLQLAVPLMPLAVRGDALLFGSRLDGDALSYTLSAVVRLRVPVLQPYAIVGHGRYARTATEKTSGWNVGGGVRVGPPRIGLFGEIRRHDPIGRTVTVVGLTF